MPTMWDVPVEVLAGILKHLSVQGLAKVTRVSRKFKGAVELVAISYYDSRPMHRVSSPPVAKFELMVEQYRFNEAQKGVVGAKAIEDDDIERAIGLLVWNCQCRTDAELLQGGEHLLLALDGCKDNQKAEELRAAALLVQKRLEEAGNYYQKMIGCHPLPERTLVLATRCGWPAGMPYPEATSTAVLAGTFMAASATGDLGYLQRVRERWLPLPENGTCWSAAQHAVVSGHVDILQYLYARDLHLAAPRPRMPNHLLDLAAGPGHMAVIDFLFTIGARPDIRAVKAAASGAQIEIIRHLFAHEPELRPSCINSGYDHLQDVFEMLFLSLKHRQTLLDFWVGEVGLDIRHAGPDGRSAIHFAAKHGSTELMQAVLAFGADIGARDHRGMPAVEVALQSQHDELATWLLQMEPNVFSSDIIESIGDMTIEQFKERKYNLAQGIIDHSRDMYIQLLAIGTFGVRFEGKTLEEKSQTIQQAWAAAGMDHTIGLILSDEFSITALEEYCTCVLGSSTEALIQQATLAALNRRQYPEDSLDLSENQLASLSVVDVLPQTLGLCDHEVSSPAAASRSIAYHMSPADLTMLAEYFSSSLGTMMSKSWARCLDTRRNPLDEFAYDCSPDHPRPIYAQPGPSGKCSLFITLKEALHHQRP